MTKLFSVCTVQIPIDANTILNVRVSSCYLSRNNNDRSEQNPHICAILSAPQRAGERLGSPHQGWGGTATQPQLA